MGKKIKNEYSSQKHFGGGKCKRINSMRDIVDRSDGQASRSGIQWVEFNDLNMVCQCNDPCKRDHLISGDQNIGAIVKSLLAQNRHGWGIPVPPSSISCKEGKCDGQMTKSHKKTRQWRYLCLPETVAVWQNALTTLLEADVPVVYQSKTALPNGRSIYAEHDKKSVFSKSCTKHGKQRGNKKKRAAPRKRNEVQHKKM